MGRLAEIRDEGIFAAPLFYVRTYWADSPVGAVVLELVGGVEGVVGAAVRPDEHHAPRKVVVARAVLLGLFPAEPSMRSGYK